jgi:hypothetical protein
MLDIKMGSRSGVSFLSSSNLTSPSSDHQLQESALLQAHQAHTMHPADRKQNMQRLQRELKLLKEEPVPGVHAVVGSASGG